MNITAKLDYLYSVVFHDDNTSIVVATLTVISIFLVQMITRCLARLFHTKPSSWAAEKSHLAILRKRTGYTFTNCKKALQLHNNDVNKAEAWLKEQAQALGWSKATKLEGRQTSQGLIAVAVHHNNAVLVELNCETDFVARNDTFKTMAETAAKACLAFAESQTNEEGNITKIGFDAEQLKLLKAGDGKTLADHLALMIGTVGENASLCRAVCLKGEKGVHVCGYAHPSGNEHNSVLLGRLGGLVALKQTSAKDVSLGDLGKQLCQHIVGMDPKRIGAITDEPAKNVDDEECLLLQEFVNDSSVLVRDVLEENEVDVVDFKRFECGETANALGEPLEMVETCQ